MQKKTNRLFYASVHYWLKYNYGVATKCENKECKNISKNYNWALLKDKKYDFKRENFIQLCRSCHAKYDITDETREKMSSNYKTRLKYCKRGHKYTKENTYYYPSNSKSNKMCRSCKICMSEYKKEWNKNNREKNRGYSKKHREIISPPLI